LEENFLFLYGDNYAPIDLTEYLQHYEADSSNSRVLVYENYDGYSRSNVLIKTDFSVSAYGVKVPSDHPTQLVDIGYVLMNKTELADFRFSPELHFGKDILVPIIERGRLVADIVRAKYFTVGTMSRLQAARAFFKGDKYIFLDRDGVLNEKAPRGEYVLNYDQFIWRQGALEGLRLIKELGVKCILITNQAGIGRGLMSESELDDIHIKMCMDARRNGGEISHIYYCPHHWEDECDCRKPKPGMLLQAQKDLLFDISETYFIGDDDRDGEAAKSAGAKFVKCEENMDLASIVSASFMSQQSEEYQ
jgi:D-glycero-D-manno-heptose 1,7-bisphosphate phosphatase